MPVRVLLVVAFLAGTAVAQDSPPDVSENAWLDHDFGGAKAGEWVKRRLERDGEKAIEYRVACVAVDADAVWIEEDRTTAEYWPGTVILCSIGRKDRKVLRAFWGKPGETGRELRLTRARLPDPGNDAATGTAEVTAAKVKVGERELDAEKIEIKTTAEGFGAPVKARQLIVLAPEVPFPLYVDENGVCPASIQEGKIEWKGKPAWKGGLVKLEFEGGTKSTLTLADCGTDAKATLRKP
ncbi:MAG: hypothetical protein HYY18_19730 [Planctomycetes bacterium]|nr:hypothetical protein [Planctomycetota bacterium]